MNSIRDQISIGFQAAVFLLIWVVLLVIKGVSLEIGWEAVKLIPDVIGVYALLVFVFVKWLWKCSVFRRWLVTTPVIQGTWKGTMQTTWKNPDTGQIPGPIEVYIVIRQTLRTTNITMFTEESTSESDAAALCIDEEVGKQILSYSYSNVPKSTVRNRSEIHYGSARLRISLRSEKILEGEYWTDRKSTGHMKLTYYNKTKIERFPLNQES